MPKFVLLPLVHCQVHTAQRKQKNTASRLHEPCETARKMARTKDAAHGRLEAIALTTLCATHTRLHTHQERPICQPETDGEAFRKAHFKLDHTLQKGASQRSEGRAV